MQRQLRNIKSEGQVLYWHRCCTTRLQQHCYIRSTVWCVDLAWHRHGCSMPSPHAQLAPCQQVPSSGGQHSRHPASPLTCQPLAAQVVVVQALQRHARSLLIGHADEAEALVATGGPVAQQHRCQLTPATALAQPQTLCT
jgi:hypothetical protein